ncbi:LysM peptidoglycan-binding domain-containing protein [Bradyrhizobium sp.]|uniref:LysM peptidoglycan-binding domain-containing protein n=1 Tax=Bradyrhizobium sp. TaxID=376 RepID=UPI0025C1FEC0|nr:LysM peptidoglycan-binding domain-containing protein [Bradyrhizobium sp.]
MSRLIVIIAGVVTAAGVAVAVANRHLLQPVETAAPAVALAAAEQASGARGSAPAALAAVRQNIDELAAGLAGSPPPSRDGVPEFDIVRIEPSGEAVVAGRAAPGSTVELLRNGEPHDRAVAGQSGEFAMIPRPLPHGTYDLTLRAKQPDGKEVTSRQSVAVALEEAADEKPMVALMTPDRPTVVLSQPTAPAASAVAVDAVDVEPNGKTRVSGRARPGATVRLYLNDSFVAPVTADPDGRFAVTINGGVAPGNYRARLDEVDSSSGKVRARAEAPFSVPDVAITASVPAQISAATPPDAAAAREPHSAVAVATTVPDGTSPSVVEVPKIATITVSRGDSLWRISQRALGAGTRYATVFKANREQIRNPNLIYPGQVFVLPAGEARP